MLISKKVTLGVTLAASAAIALSACGSSSSSSKGGGSGGSSSSGGGANTGFTYNKGPTGGTAGGTLKALTEDDVTTLLPAGAYDTASYSALRLYSRPLYSYAASNDPSKRLDVQPDAADGQPQVSSDGLTYTIKMKQGVDWDIDGQSRQVTAQDAVRGIKLTCNPIVPFGAPYFTESIAGLKSFCDGFANVSQTDAGALKSYVEGHQVSGLQAVDDSTLKITLTGKFSDFMHFLALPCDAPANIEQLNYVLDSPSYRAHTYSDGPYRITSYTADKNITFQRNPFWKASTDSLRKAYANEIDLVEGGDPTTLMQQIQAGTADALFSNEPVPTTSIPSLLASGTSNIHINASGGTESYLVFNLLGGSAAIKNPLVRQAINYAVNKQAISAQLGGSKIAPVLNQIFPAGVVGEGWKEQDLYPSSGNTGDPTKAKQLLAQAGYPNGLTLKYTYRTKGNHPVIADSVKTALARAGITVELKGVVNSNYYSNYLQKTSIAKSGDWDMAEPGWFPDWEGDAERSYYTPLFDGRQYTDGSTNYGDYNDDAVNTLADKALTETDQSAAANDWNQVDAMIMKDAPWTPIVGYNQATLVSSRTKNFEYYFPGSGVDLSNLAVQ